MDCFGDLESYGKRRKRSAFDHHNKKKNATATKEYFLTATATLAPYTEEEEEEPVLTNSVDIDGDKKKHHRTKRNTRTPRFLPEHVDLGLRLTVGEEVNQKPFLPSSAGEGHFPEYSPYTSPKPGGGAGGGANGGNSNLNSAYYPALNNSGRKITNKWKRKDCSFMFLYIYFQLTRTSAALPLR